jgi:hypothetical protein
MDALPNAGLHPFVKPTPVSHATAAAEFARQVFLWYSGLEHEMAPQVFGALTQSKYGLVGVVGRKIVDTGPV